jgi:hypothetical protein
MMATRAWRMAFKGWRRLRKIIYPAHAPRLILPRQKETMLCNKFVL